MDVLYWGGSGLEPPSWILGTWADSYDINTYKFTSDDVEWSIGGTTISFKEVYKDSEVSDVSTDTSYTVNIDATKFKFEKTSATTLDYTLSGMTIELIKK